MRVFIRELPSKDIRMEDSPQKAAEDALAVAGSPALLSSFPETFFRTLR
jgi:hypothetical protein